MKRFMGYIAGYIGVNIMMLVTDSVFAWYFGGVLIAIVILIIHKQFDKS